MTGALGLTFSISFPPIYSSVLRWMGVLKLDIFEVMPFSCYGFSFSFHSSLLLRTLSPLGLLAFSSVWTLSFRGRNAKLAVIGEKLLTVTFFLVFLVYPTTSQLVFSAFNCVSFDDPGKTRALRQDLAIDCDSAGHQLMQAYSGIMIMIYPIGVPLVYLYLLYVRFGPTLRLMRENEELRVLLRSEAVSGIMLERRTAAHTRGVALTIEGQQPPTDAELPKEVTSKIASLEAEIKELHTSLPDYIKKLISGYRAVRFEFEVFECGRKLALVCMPVFFPPGSNAQLIFGLMVCFVTFGFYTMMAPFTESRANTYAQLCQIQIFFCLLSAVALRTDGEGSRNNMDILLTSITILTLSTTLVLRTPLQQFLEASERARLMLKLSRLWAGRRHNHGTKSNIQMPPAHAAVDDQQEAAQDQNATAQASVVKPTVETEPADAIVAQSLSIQLKQWLSPKESPAPADALDA